MALVATKPVAAAGATKCKKGAWALEFRNFRVQQQGEGLELEACGVPHGTIMYETHSLSVSPRNSGYPEGHGVFVQAS